MGAPWYLLQPQAFAGWCEALKTICLLEQPPVSPALSRPTLQRVSEAQNLPCICAASMLPLPAAAGGFCRLV